MHNSIDIKVRSDVTGRDIHAFVYLLQNLQSNFYVANNGRRVSGASIIGVISLNICKGSTITVIANNDNKETLVDDLFAVVHFFENLYTEHSKRESENYGTDNS